MLAIENMMFTKCLSITTRVIRPLLQTTLCRHNVDLINSLSALDSLRRFNIHSVLISLQDQSITTENCRKLHENVITKAGGNSFWSIFMHVACELKLYELANCAANFVLEKPELQNTSTLIDTLYVLASANRLEEFREFYTLVMNRMDKAELAAVASDLIFILCMTPEWEKAIPLMPLTSTLGNASKLICEAAARYASFERVISIIDDLPRSHPVPSDIFFSALLSRLSSIKNAYWVVGELLAVVQRRCWRLSEKSAILLSDWFNNHQPPAYKSAVNVRLSGTLCPHCNMTLPPTALRADVINNLALHFYDSVIKEQLYLKGTPADLEDLDRFLKDQTDRFDCVIDFQNLVHISDQRDPVSVGRLLSECILTLHRRFNFRRFCLVSKGNKMLRSRKFWELIKRSGDHLGVSVFDFVVNTNSDDDIFSLYMTLWSGPDCYVVSNDEFRQHRCLLDLESGFEFLRWQSARQISFEGKKWIKFLYPMQCEAYGAMHTGWHIPYEPKRHRVSYVPSNLWICVRPINSSSDKVTCTLPK